MTKDPDTQTMLQFKGGDADCFRILFERYKKKIATFCYRFCGNREIAEELAQEVFLRVYKAAPGYRPEAKFSTWLFRIAVNVCLNEIRKPGYQVMTESIDSSGKTGESAMHREIEDKRRATPQDIMEQKEINIQLNQAIKKLPKKQKAALILRVNNEFSYNEIGKQIRCSEKGVKSLIHRARKALVKEIQKSNSELKSET